MRTAAKVTIVLGILGALAFGLLGPLVAAGHLHDYANSAAEAGYAQLGNSGPASLTVEQAVRAAAAKHSDVTVTAVRVTTGAVTVVLQEKIHSFMSGFPGLKDWFTVNATETATAYG